MIIEVLFFGKLENCPIRFTAAAAGRKRHDLETEAFQAELMVIFDWLASVAARQQESCQ